MTESTGYLDMNKKNLCHPNKINQLSFVLFFKKGIFVFQTEPNSIDRSIASNPKKTSHPNPQETLFHPLSPTRFDPKKKKFPCFFPKKNFFFHPRPGFELTLKRSWFPPQRAPSARRGRRFPARARPPPPPPPPPLLLPTNTTISSNRDRKKERGIEPRYRQKSDRYQTSV